MMVKTQAVVLRTLKYGESQLVVDLFTRSMGCVSFIQRIQKSRKGRTGLRYFQPLTILEVSYDYSQKRQLQRLSELSIAYPFSCIPFDPYKEAIALFVAEFLYHCVRGEHNPGSLYPYVEASIRWLDSSAGAFANFHLVFMMHLSRFVGFYPNLEDYSQGDFFDLRDGVFCPHPPSHPDYVVPTEASKICLLMRMNYESMHLFRFSRAERNRCVDLILHYYRLHIPSFPALRSLSVLQELFR